MIFDPETMDPTACYKLLIGSVVPRAIGWASTLTPDGIPNLAPLLDTYHIRTDPLEGDDNAIVECLSPHRCIYQRRQAHVR